MAAFTGTQATSITNDTPDPLKNSREFKELRSLHRLLIAFIEFVLSCLNFDKRVTPKSAFT